MDQKDFEMANGKYRYGADTLDWRKDPYYFSAVNLDRDVPDPDEDEDEEDDWEDMEDDTHDGGSHREASGRDDWSGYHDDLD